MNSPEAVFTGVSTVMSNPVHVLTFTIFFQLYNIGQKISIHCQKPRVLYGAHSHSFVSTPA